MKHRNLLFGFVLFFGLASIAWTPAPRDWERLGSRKVNFAVDRDEIAVTVREGTFRQIKLHVARAGVTFRDLKIHYANGDVQDVPLRRTIPAGGETRLIDLAGRDRVIRKVRMVYNTKPRRSRRAVVTLWGRQ